MRFINILGSMIFFFVGYKTLKQGDFFDLTQRQIYAYGSYFAVCYIATQGLGVIFHKPGRQFWFYTDLFFSSLPLFIVYESFIRPLSDEAYYAFFRTIYCSVTVLDLVIFTVLAFRFALLTNEFLIQK